MKWAGFYRDGCCSTGPEDLGGHTICVVVTAEFLEHQRFVGNDLSTPVPQYPVPRDRARRPLVRHCRALASGPPTGPREGCAAPGAREPIRDKAIPLGRI
jgi:uncharacterized protein